MDAMTNYYELVKVYTYPYMYVQKSVGVSGTQTPGQVSVYVKCSPVHKKVPHTLIHIYVQQQKQTLVLIMYLAIVWLLTRCQQSSDYQQRVTSLLICPHSALSTPARLSASVYQLPFSCHVVSLASPSPLTLTILHLLIGHRPTTVMALAVPTGGNHGLVSF
jgi:hypothetical protein